MKRGDVYYAHRFINEYGMLEEVGGVYVAKEDNERSSYKGKITILMTADQVLKTINDEPEKVGVKRSKA